MSSFLSKVFAHKQYAAFRPSYPAELYAAVLQYHRTSGRDPLRHRLALDLGTGHGVVVRSLAPHFTKVVGTDPSAGMIKQAQTITQADALLQGPGKVVFRQAPAEKIDFLADGAVDLVTAGQAAHWFDYPTLWPEMARLTRPVSTLAFFGYKDHVLPQYPRASELIQHYAYSKEPHLLGSYWQQPGRSIVQDKLRKVIPPPEQWEDVQRIEYEPDVKAGLGGGQGTRFMSARMKLGAMEEYIRTWSSFHEWQRKFPDRKRRGTEGDTDGKGDVIDELMDKVRETEPQLQGDGSPSGWKDLEVDVEWGSALILARRR
ncbi:trans-aconitate methyltransferase 1 [Diaporthe australafricana]|uniref:Trans-aconitate methyltransferase 1 n=1 Tax=Diaporthe australafricana TaxID=127596 RepID=A0ABR3VV14_9PEZI